MGRLGKQKSTESARVVRKTEKRTKEIAARRKNSQNVKRYKARVVGGKVAEDLFERGKAHRA